MEQGKVEETYAHAVAALTGNQEVVEAYKNYKAGEGFSPGDEELDQRDPENEDDTCSNEEDSNSDEESDGDDENRFVKVPRTKEELEAEKAELKAGRKANKKAVREAKAEKRQSKIKKKDKKRAIKKAKAGNRKN
ncbi:MAG: hypothetical protein SGILL_009337 [Bacillariaceae sp.]